MKPEEVSSSETHRRAIATKIRNEFSKNGTPCAAPLDAAEVARQQAARKAAEDRRESEKKRAEQLAKDREACLRDSRGDRIESAEARVRCFIDVALTLDTEDEEPSNRPGVRRTSNRVVDGMERARSKFMSIMGDKIKEALKKLLASTDNAEWETARELLKEISDAIDSGDSRYNLSKAQVAALKSGLNGVIQQAASYHRLHQSVQQQAERAGQLGNEFVTNYQALQQAREQLNNPMLDPWSKNLAMQEMMTAQNSLNALQGQRMQLTQQIPGFQMQSQRQLSYLQQTGFLGREDYMQSMQGINALIQQIRMIGSPSFMNAASGSMANDLTSTFNSGSLPQLSPSALAARNSALQRSYTPARAPGARAWPGTNVNLDNYGLTTGLPVRGPNNMTSAMPY